MERKRRSAYLEYAGKLPDFGPTPIFVTGKDPDGKEVCTVAITHSGIAVYTGKKCLRNVTWEGLVKVLKKKT